MPDRDSLDHFRSNAKTAPACGTPRRALIGQGSSLSAAVNGMRRQSFEFSKPPIEGRPSDHVREGKQPHKGTAIVGGCAMQIRVSLDVEADESEVIAVREAFFTNRLRGGGSGGELLPQVSRCKRSALDRLRLVREHCSQGVRRPPGQRRVRQRKTMAAEGRRRTTQRPGTGSCQERLADRARRLRLTSMTVRPTSMSIRR